MFASTAHKVRGLTIVPITFSIKADDDHTSIFFMQCGNKRFGLLHPGPKCHSMAFFIRSSDKLDECNCCIKKVKSESGEYPSIIECTVISNSKKVSAGEELVLYRERTVKVVEKTVKVSLDNAAVPTAKKVRHG